MKNTHIGSSPQRKDALAKVTGRAKYTADMDMRGMLHGKIFRSTIAHGRVTSLDCSRAEALEGVVAVVTYDDCRGIVFPTAGHPYAIPPARNDRADRNLLTDRIRLYGDEIAAVVAEDPVTAEKALELIEVEYEEYPFYLDPEDAVKEDAVHIHDGGNILGQNSLSLGEEDPEEVFKEAAHIIEDIYESPQVQHCHMENHICYAYKDDADRIVVVSSTQIPHIARRIMAHAFSMPFSKFRVIKPVIGGGFGNKQDVVLEPLTAFLTMKCSGRPVMIDLSREECMAWTRSRHGMRHYMKTGVDRSGRIIAKTLKSYGTNGAYASHCHSVVAKQGGDFLRHYPASRGSSFQGYTVYTNTATAGAMRGYGIPQINFAVESHMDDVARAIGMDPVEFRKINVIKEGQADPVGKLKLDSYGLSACFEKGLEYIGWEKKRELYKDQTGEFRRGIGFASFGYATGVWPISQEIAGARITMNQDGTVQLQVGATELGQGSTTVFCQMAAETLGISYEMVNLNSTTDTDMDPFDTGAYASRQTFVTGNAVHEAAVQLKAKVLARAAARLEREADSLDIRDARIVEAESGADLIGLDEIALDSYYHLPDSGVMTADVSTQTKTNPQSWGVTVAEVEVDMQTGKVKVLDICNIHDCGRVLNPLLAEGQVQGGMSMSLGFGLSEIMLYDPNTGRPLNNNLLDYKLPTSMDTPELGVKFTPVHENSAAYGSKSLGEPPAISPASAVRNAVLHASGVGINSLPINPQKLFEAFKKADVLNKETINV